MNLPYRRSKLFICDDVLLERSVLVDSTVRDQTGIGVHVSDTERSRVLYCFSTAVHVVSLSRWYSRTHDVPLGKVTRCPLTW